MPRRAVAEHNPTTRTADRDVLVKEPTAAAHSGGSCRIQAQLGWWLSRRRRKPRVKGEP